tara:strand:+ start:3730 stop:4590 length:861 start_codon:yes stop_codon:yes gene_type:complete
MYYLDGEPLPLNRAFKDSEGNQYPADWLRKSTQAQRDALGITWVAPDPEPDYDARFYWNAETPKDLDELKEQWTAQQRVAAGHFLLQTDWYAARAHDSGRPIPDAVALYRQGVRSTFEVRAGEIDACADVDELAALVTALPVITKVIQDFVPPTFDEETGEELTPAIPEELEFEANPDALTGWPELGEVIEYPAVDYRSFYGALQASPVYAAIRAQAAETLAVNVYCTEFIASIGEAKAGLPQALVIQQCIDDLIGAVTLSAAERTELEDLMTAYGLAEVYTLPTS